jgi:PPOX class probable F420-dependent enzyme
MNFLSDNEKYVSLVSYRASGTGVPTAVWFAKFGDAANTYCVITEANAGKVKRIRKNPKIEVQACDIKGNVTASATTYSGFARLVTGTEAVAVRKAISKRYGITYKLFSVYNSIGSLLKRRYALPETNIIFTLND